LGVDANNAHVQPTGAYHYHGLPTALLDMLKVGPSAHSSLVGWAADGFPIYAMDGNTKANDPGSAVKELLPSYLVKRGNRPTGGNNPGGRYDGTFLADYEYAAGAGDLDECNGRWTVTRDFPKGTYAYFLTRHWPVIPRCFKGTPDKIFVRGPPPGMMRDGMPPPWR